MMYENYLLDPEAIAQVLCEEAKEKIVTDEQVTQWLRRNGGDQKYYQQEWNEDITDEEWLKGVKSSRLLDDMFGDLTDARFIYRKTIHSVALTEWLLEHRRERLNGLLEFVRGIDLN